MRSRLNHSPFPAWTLLGNKLVAAGAKQVILVPAAIGNTNMSEWSEGARLNGMLMGLLVGLKYKVNAVLWHQGENDFVSGTTEADYARMFHSLVRSIRERGVDAPVFVSVTTVCGINPRWTPDNPVARAKRVLPSRDLNIFPGVDTDTRLQHEDRYEGCHFSGTGQEKFASAWVEILRKDLSKTKTAQ